MYLEDAEDIADLEKYDKWPDANNYDWAHYSEKIGDLHEKCVIKLPAGGIDIQGVLPNGTPDEVRAAVKNAVNILAMYDISIR